MKFPQPLPQRRPCKRGLPRIRLENVTQPDYRTTGTPTDGRAMKLRHYYHVYADGKYRQIVSSHFAALNSTGLIDELDSLHIGFVGNGGHVKEARQLVRHLTRRPFTSNVASVGWEQETQDVLYRNATEAAEPFLALYAHTKGASSQTEINELWRYIMTRHTVRNWKHAIGAIRGNVAAAGCFWAPFDNGRLIGHAGGTQYFAGTFWWARSDAIARIGPPDRSVRYDAESWIGKITKLSKPFEVACLFDAPLELGSLRRHAAAMQLSE